MRAVPLVPLLERIYETGRVETEQGDVRPAQPVGIPRTHAIRLAELVREHGLLSTLETGMAYGLSTLAIAGVHAERDAGHHIAIDPTADMYYEGIAMANLRRAGLDDRVRLIAEASQLALPRLVDEGVRVDFAFIDGMHLFDYALIDFFYIDQMLTSGGFVAFHDTWMPSVEDVVRFALTNREYEKVPGGDASLALLRKLQPDTRSWTHYVPFARRPAIEGPPEERARRLYAELREGAEQAAQRAGGFRDHDLAFAGRSLRTRFAGEALEPVILAAFAHARGAATAPPDVELVLWDGKSSGIDDPARPWTLGEVRARGDIRGFDDEPLTVFTDPVSGAITVFDREERTIVYWIADPAMMPWHERGAPLRAALHHWTADAGLYFVHSGAVGTRGAGVLLAGASGSGKSTTALACLAAGFDYAGDDYVIVSGGDRASAHCVYSTAKLDGPALDRLPALAPAVVDFRRGVDQKAVLELQRLGTDVLRPSVRVDAIVVPSVGGGGASQLRAATAAQALRALAPSTVLQLPGGARERMAGMARLARSVPTYTLALGDDVTAVPGVIGDLCGELAQAREHAAEAG